MQQPHTNWEDFQSAKEGAPMQTAGVILLDRCAVMPSLEVFRHFASEHRKATDSNVTLPECAREFSARFKPEPQDWDALRRRGDVPRVDDADWTL